MPGSTDLGSHYGLRSLLPPPARVWRYEGQEDFLRVCKSELSKIRDDQHSSEFLVFTDVNKSAFLRDFQNAYDWKGLVSFSTYDSTSNVLIVKMITSAHGTATAIFDRLFVSALNPQSLKKELKSGGATTFDGDGMSKSADATYGPRIRAHRQNQRWPTLAVEIAVTEPRTKLLNDVDFWLLRTYDQVQIVLTIRVTRTRREDITIEKWVAVEGRPHREQIITIQKPTGRDNTPVVTGAPLRLEFDQVFQRPRVAGEGEIIVTEEALKEFADDIWT